MIVILKEVVSFLLMLSVLAVSRAEYQALFLRLNSSPSVALSFLPEVMSTIIFNIVAIVLVFMVTRWWVYKKPTVRNVLYHALFVLPFQYVALFFVVILFLVFRITVVSYGSTIQIWLYSIFFASLYYFLVYWFTTSAGMNIRGDNPWYNLVDCFSLSRRQKLEVLGLYSVPLIGLIFFILQAKGSIFFACSMVAVYLFTRQYIASKKKSVRQYTHFLWHSYTKTCKTVYRKVFH